MKIHLYYVTPENDFLINKTRSEHYVETNAPQRGVARSLVLFMYVYYVSLNSVLLYAMYQLRALICHIMCYSHNPRSTGRYLHQVRTG